MKKPGLKFLSMAIAAAMLLPLTGCNQKQAGPTESTSATAATTAPATTASEKKPATISFLTTQSRNKEVRTEMSKVLLADENIKVDWQVVPDPQYNNMVLTKIASNELPDLLDINQTDDFATYTIDNFADLSSEPWVARLVKDQHLRVDGKIYALPLTAPSIGIGCFYNKKVFADAGITQVPATYAEFLEALEKVKAIGKVPVYMSSKDLWTVQIFGFLAFQCALGDNGIPTYEKLLKNELKWSEIPEFKQVLVDYQELFNKGYTNKDHTTATYDMAKENVATGKAAIMINGNWCATDIAAKWPEAEIGFFPLPYKDSAKMLSSDTVWGYPAAKNSKHLEDVKRFLDLWSQPKYMDMYFAANPGIPAFKDVNGGNLNAAEKEMVANYVSKGLYFTKTINEAMPVMGPVYGDVLYPLYVTLSIKTKTPDQVVTEWEKSYMEFMKSKNQPGF